MPSDLFRRALASLSDAEQEAYERWSAQLATYAGSPVWPASGARVLENLKEEAHLVGDGAFGDPAEMSGFLRCCASRAAEHPPEWPAGYEADCRGHAGRGLRVSRAHLPDRLLRYTTTRSLASRFVERMLGKRARAAFESESLAPETAFTRIQSRWNPSLLQPDDRLHRDDHIFATFEHPAGAPRHDAVAMSQALALPFWQGPRKPEILIEIGYPTDQVDAHRFPTVADAGWIHLFRPASEEAPDGARLATCCGWTEPLGAFPPQPEIVHANAPLQVLSGPPRLVGSIP